MNIKSVLWIILKIISFRTYLFVLLPLLFFYNHTFASSMATNGGVFISTNSGFAWTLLNNLPETIAVRSLVISDANVFACTVSGVYWSFNKGTDWTLINEYKPMGNYSVKFNGGNLASGIYLYRLESGNYSAVKKFILMK